MIWIAAILSMMFIIIVVLGMGMAYPGITIGLLAIWLIFRIMREYRERKELEIAVQLMKERKEKKKVQTLTVDNPALRFFQSRDETVIHVPVINLRFYRG